MTSTSAPSSLVRTALWVVVLSLVGSAPLAWFAWRAFSESEAALRPVRDHFREMGPTATPDQCVAEVLEWRPTCTALKGLCGRSVPELVYSCMGTGDRAEYCASITQDSLSTEFGFGDCESRGYSQRDPTCAAAWRSVANFCNGRSPTRLM